LQPLVEEDRMARSWKVPIVTRQTGAAPAISTLVAGDPGALPSSSASAAERTAA
jgi:hypothetical protein